MSLGLNPLALAAATVSLGAHVAMFGALLFAPADETTEVAHLVSIVVAAPLPSPSMEQDAATRSTAPAPPRPDVPEQAPEQQTAIISTVEPTPPIAIPTVTSAMTPAPTVRAVPRAKPVTQSSEPVAISIVEASEVARLGPVDIRRSAARAAPTIETRIALTPGNTQPRYPLIARKRGYEGRTIVRVQVSEQGRVLSAKIARSSGHEVLDLAARDAVTGWMFRPAIRDGRPTTGQIEVPIEFRLR